MEKKNYRFYMYFMKYFLTAGCRNFQGLPASSGKDASYDL